MSRGRSSRAVGDDSSAHSGRSCESGSISITSPKYFDGLWLYASGVLHDDGATMTAPNPSASPWTLGKDGVLTLTRSELDLFLDGCTLIGKLDLTPRWLTHQDLVVGEIVNNDGEWSTSAVSS